MINQAVNWNSLKHTDLKQAEGNSDLVGERNGREAVAKGDSEKEPRRRRTKQSLHTFNLDQL